MSIIGQQIITIQLTNFLSIIQVTIQLTDHTAIGHIFTILVPDTMPAVFVFRVNLPWSHSSNSESVQDADQHLEKEDKEEDHEVDRAVIPENEKTKLVKNSIW